jgi:hypothetical protein
VQALVDDLRALLTDPVVHLLALRRHRHPGGAQVAGVLHAADETALVQHLDHAGEHGRVQALELVQLGQAERSAGADQGEDGVLGRGEVLARGRVVKHAGKPVNDRAQPRHEFAVHHVSGVQLECLLASN